MDILFRDPGIEKMLESILMFQAEGESDFWLAPLYHFYPHLDRERAMLLHGAERDAYIGDTLRETYRELAPVIAGKAAAYQSCQEHEAEIRRHIEESEK